MCLDCLFLEIASDLILSQENHADWVKNSDIFVFFFLAFVEQPLTGFSNVVVVENESPSDLIFGKIATERVVELLNIALINS